MYIDTHTHLHHKRFNRDRNEIMEQADRAGVKMMIEVPIEYESNVTMREVLHGCSNVKFAVGIHPTRVWEETDRAAWMEKIAHLAGLPGTVAIGEVGLDHCHAETEVWREQELWFGDFLELAKQMKLPVILHVRDAFEDAVRVLCEHGDENGYRGVVHCFYGTWDEAKQYLELGFYLGFGGAITRDIPEVKEMVKNVPLERIVLETDCPFLVPDPLEGRNSPVNIPVIAKAIAYLKGISVAEVETVTTKNAMELFDWQ